MTAIYYSALWWKIIPLRNVFTARLPHVLLTSLLVFFIYGLTFKIVKNKKLALLTTVVAVFSPWYFHITRLALDIPLALVALLAGINLHLDKKRIGAYLLYAVAAYAYLGYRVLLPFLAIYVEGFFFLEKANFVEIKRSILYTLAFLVIFFGSNLLIDKNVTTERLNAEVLFINNTKASEKVIFNRNTSQATGFMPKLFDNKLTASTEQLLENLLLGLNPSYLFKNGDYSPINGTASGGQYFIFLLPAFIYGLMKLGNQKKTIYYLGGFIFLGMLPALLSSVSSTYAIRASLSNIGFSLLIALGILEGYRILKHKKIHVIFAIIMVPIVGITLASYVYGYYFRRPLLVSELYNAKEKNIALWLIKDSSPKKLTIFDNNPKELYLSYAFLNNAFGIQKLNLNTQDGASTYSYKNLTFRKCIHNPTSLYKKNSIVADSCLSEGEYNRLAQKADTQILKAIKMEDISLRYAYFIFR
jgi:4-amino-4-deoxy-L-arabinose transferase-like glycosyltransferase